MILRSKFIVSCLISISTLYAKSTEPTGPTLEYKIAIGLLDATHHNGSATRLIVHPERPIQVEENAYFWDAQYLPATNTSDCAKFESGNKRGNVTICDVGKQKRCSRGINDLVSVFKHKITFDSGVSPSQLVWLCLPPKFCCELKCCDPSAPYYKIITGCSLFLLFVPFCIAMYRMTAADDDEDNRHSKPSIQESRT